MNIDFVPSPLKTTSPVGHCRSTEGIFFELEPMMQRTQNMFDSAANGHLNDLESYLSNNNYKAELLDQNGYSVLHHAAKMNRVRIIDFVSTAASTVDIYSEDGLTPLHLAARSNALEALDVLLKKGAKVNASCKGTSRSPLHLATQFGHKEIIQRLLKERDLDVDASDQQGMTSLHVAVSRGYEEICDALLKFQANVTLTTAKDQTCLHLAAASGNKNIVLSIVQSATEVHLRHPGDAIRSIKDVPQFYQFINRTDAAQNTALHMAVQAGNAETCQILIDHGADMNMQNNSLHTPVHMATIRKNSEILQLLIDQGAHTYTKDFKKKTALHSAASSGTPECLEILLKNCAFVNDRENNDLTPFLCAVAGGNTKCAELLIDSGASITTRDKFQRTCFHLAVVHEHENVLKMLLDRCGGSGLVNAPDGQEKTPLHYAVLSSNIRLHEILLQHKANCLLKDSAGKTPLHVAAEAGMVCHVEALVKSSLSSISQMDGYDRTPLHFAALNGQGNICSILIQMGAEIDNPDMYGWTPFLFAAKNGSVRLVRMFLDINANIDHADQSGNTALLIASARGHVDVVNALLDRNASLNPGNDGLNCLDVAIENQQAGVVMAILKNSRWRDILLAKSPDGGNRMGKLIHRFPDAAKSVMDRCIQKSLAKRSITYDFRLLDPGPVDQSGSDFEPFFGLLEMVKHKQKDLLVHALSRKLLQIKWRTYGWFIFWTNLALYAVFLFVMSYFMLTQRKQIKLQRSSETDYGDVFKKKDTFNKISPFLILVFALFHLLKELYQMGFQRMKYFTQSTNFLEWTLYLTTTIFILPYVSDSLRYLQGDPRVTWQIGTVAIFLGYMNLILFVQTLESVGIYVTMFFQVAKTVIQALIFFALFALAFSVVFYILFKEQDAFSSFDMALMQVLKMTLGELDYNTVMVDSLDQTNEDTKAPLLPYRESSTIFMAIFIFAMPIILTNLLVGLAVGDIESVQKHAFLRNKEKVVDFVVGIERKFPKFITSRFYKPNLVVMGRKVARKLSQKNRVDKFEDKDLGDEDMKSENGEDQRLEVVTKELVKVKQRQTSIMDIMQDQMNILKAVATKVGVDIPQGEGNNAIQ